MNDGLVTFERDFTPEAHGWYVDNPVVPQQQRESAIQELHTFGFVSTCYVRFEIPYHRPAVLIRMGWDERSGRYYGLYMPPIERDSLHVTAARIHRELRTGLGGGIVSPCRPSVS